MLDENQNYVLNLLSNNQENVCIMGVMGVSTMNTPNNPKIKEKFPNLIKGIIENIKVNVIPYRITNKTGRLSLLLFTVLMEGMGSNQERK